MSHPETASLTEELAALRREVALLQTEIARHRNASRTSLKEHHRCPQCQGTSILHCDEIQDHTASGPVPMSIQLSGSFSLRTVGDFEVFICRRCELAEWYVKGVGDIDPQKLNKKYRKLVRIIDNETPGNGPFR